MKRLLIGFALWYLRIAAKIQIAKIRPTIIGIAGSSGKSSLARILKQTLLDQYSVLSSEGKNSETGIPLGILGIQMKNYKSLDWIKTLFIAKWQLLTNWKKYKIFIAEMGIDSPIEPKNMSYLLKIIQPSIAAVTNVSLEHSVYFDTFVNAKKEDNRREQILEMTAEQELLLLCSIPTNGTAILNIDDEYIQGEQKNIKAKQMTLSLKNKNSDLYGNKTAVTLNHFKMDLIFKNKKYELKIDQLLPEFYAYEFLLTLGITTALNIPVDKAIESIEKHFSLPAGRFSIFEGVKNSIVIDSSYNNATLEPILGILDSLKRIPEKKRILAIIGDMRELGSQSEMAHIALAEKLAKTADEIILIGPLLNKYAVPILEKTRTKFQNFDTFTNARDAILNAVKEKDIVLVKSSQNTLFLERAVEILLADKNDVNKLCRRGDFWDEQRAKTP